jgi:hypothetical protein
MKTKCKNCNKPINSKNIFDTYCDNCDYLLSITIKLSRYFYFLIINLKSYPHKEINIILRKIIKLNNLTKKSYFFIEYFNMLHNEILIKINYLKFKNDRIKNTQLNSKTKTFLFMYYK